MEQKHKQTKSHGGEASARTRELKGTVMSDKMKDTIIVAVMRYVKHPKYKKYLKRVKRYHVHDLGNTAKVGETVTIRETKPISRHKHFILVK